MDDTGHLLLGVSTVTNHTVGWMATPSGESVPIREALPRPHHRWYCSCGAVSGKFTTRDAAFEAHKAHVSDNQSA